MEFSKYMDQCGTATTAAMRTTGVCQPTCAPSSSGLATDISGALSYAARINDSARAILYRLSGPRPEQTSSVALGDLLSSLANTESLLVDIENTLGS